MSLKDQPFHRLLLLLSYKYIIRRLCNNCIVIKYEVALSPVRRPGSLDLLQIFL